MTLSCMIPISTEKRSDLPPMPMTLALVPVWRAQRTDINVGGQPNFVRMLQSNVLYTESNALAKSTKIMYSGVSCSLHFTCNCLAIESTSMVLRSFRKPHCDSGGASLQICCSCLASINLVRTLPAVESREIPRLLPHMAVSAFFLCMPMISASLHCWKTYLVSHTAAIIVHLSSSTPQFFFLTKITIAEATDSILCSFSSHFLYSNFHFKASCCVSVRKDVTCSSVHDLDSTGFSNL